MQPQRPTQTPPPERRLHVDGRILAGRIRRDVTPPGQAVPMTSMPQRPPVQQGSPQSIAPVQAAPQPQPIAPPQPAPIRMAPPQPVYMQQSPPVAPRPAQPAPMQPVTPMQSVQAQMQTVTQAAQPTPLQPQPPQTPPMPPEVQQQVNAAPAPLPQLVQPENSSKGRSKLKVAAVSLAIIALVGGGAAGAYLYMNTSPSIATVTKQQFNFAAYLPTAKNQLTANMSTVEYDKKTKVLSYNGETENGMKMYITQQATPSSFNKDVENYNKMLAGLNPYTGFTSKYGRVSLTKPVQLGGAQTAVINGQGTLMFVRPSDQLSDKEWQQFFETLKLQR